MNNDNGLREVIKTLAERVRANKTEIEAVKSEISGANGNAKYALLIDLWKAIDAFSVKGNSIFLKGNKVHDFYVPKDGKDGKNGDPGKDGKDGEPGKDGEDGKPGRDGKDGMPGRDGKDGAPGKDGKDGEPGETVKVIYKPKLFERDGAIWVYFEGEAEKDAVKLYDIAKTTGGSGGGGGRGQRTYVHFVYSATGTPEDADIKSTSDDTTYYLGIYAGLESTPPKSANSYTWSQYRGESSGAGAYAAAVAGGYTGTEEEFDYDLAGVSEITSKANINQGASNAGKCWKVGADGGLVFEVPSGISEAYIHSDTLSDAANSVEYTNLGGFAEFDIILEAPAAAASTAYIYLTINGSKYSMLVGGFVKTNAPCQTSFTFRKIGDTWISMYRAGGSTTYIKISDMPWWDGTNITSFKVECYGTTVFPAGTKVTIKGLTNNNLAGGSGTVFDYEKIIDITESVQSITINQFDDGEALQLKELYVYLMVTASTTSNVNLELWYDANPVVAPARWASSMGYATGNLTLYAHAYIGSASKVLEVDYITGAVGAYVNYTSLLNGSLNHNIHPISYNNPPHLLYTEVKCINTIVIKSPQTTITLDSGKIVLRGVRA